MTQPVGPRGFPSWETLYEGDEIERLPWFFRELDPDLAAALDRHGVRAPARVLDQGTGPGTQAIALAKRGYAVTASDIAPAALAYASTKAAEAGVTVRFVRDDVLATELTGPFDAIFDRGCFHVLSPESRSAYAAAMHRLLAPGGFLFVKTFSHLQPGNEGPHRFGPDDVRAAFEPRFEVLETLDTVYQGQRDPLPLALFSTMRPR